MKSDQEADPPSDYETAPWSDHETVSSCEESTSSDSMDSDLPEATPRSPSNPGIIYWMLDHGAIALPYRCTCLLFQVSESVCPACPECRCHRTEDSTSTLEGIQDSSGLQHQSTDSPDGPGLAQEGNLAEMGPGRSDQECRVLRLGSQRDRSRGWVDCLFFQI